MTVVGILTRLTTFENTDDSSICVATSDCGDFSYLGVKAAHRRVRPSAWTEKTLKTEHDRQSYLLNKNAITHAYCTGLEKTNLDARCVPEEYSDSNTFDRAAFTGLNTMVLLIHTRWMSSTSVHVGENEHCIFNIPDPFLQCTHFIALLLLQHFRLWSNHVFTQFLFTANSRVLTNK